MMKFILGLFAILTIIGLGQAHQFPDFGKGLLHEDLQDILDLIPVKEINEVGNDYFQNDDEVKDFLKEMGTTTVIRDLLVDFEAIPEVIKLLNYLQKEGINIYGLMNEINKALKIKELVPPTPTTTNSQAVSTKERTGGLRGFFRDIKKHIDYDAFISIYVDKLKTSTAFANLIKQFKSHNFQKLVNKACEIKSLQYVVNRLEARSVKVKFLRDIMYLLFSINVPNPPSKTLMEELMDFYKLLPLNKILDIVIKYVNEDKKVQEAALFLLTDEFHDLLRALEATKEFQALVIYLQKTGLPIIEYINEYHHVIGMEDYVPPKVDSFFKSLIKTQEIGGGMQGMFKDLYDILPLDKIDALYKEKMKLSKVFVDFITKITSKEMVKIVKDLIANETFKEFITKTTEKGLDFEAAQKFNSRIIGLKF